MGKRYRVIYKHTPKILKPEITPRDLQLLHMLYTHCYITTTQIHVLFWPKSKAINGSDGWLKSCQERLRRLTAYKYIRRIRPFVKQGGPTQPNIYALDEQGAKKLKEKMGITIRDVDYLPKNAENNSSYLRHFLIMNDVRIALTLACTQSGVTLSKWISDKELKSPGMKDYVTLTGPRGAKRRTAVCPDACFTLERNHKQALFFSELDLGSVTEEPSQWERRGWRQKIQAYQVYLASDEYKKRYGSREAQVLTITTSNARRANMQKTTKKVGVGMDYWFTTLAQATDPNKLLTQPIWHRIGSDQQFSLLG